MTLGIVRQSHEEQTTFFFKLFFLSYIGGKKNRFFFVQPKMTDYILYTCNVSAWLPENNMVMRITFKVSEI